VLVNLRWLSDASTLPYSQHSTLCVNYRNVLYHTVSSWLLLNWPIFLCSIIRLDLQTSPQETFFKYVQSTVKALIANTRNTETTTRHHTGQPVALAGTPS